MAELVDKHGLVGSDELHEGEWLRPEDRPCYRKVYWRHILVDGEFEEVASAVTISTHRWHSLRPDDLLLVQDALEENAKRQIEECIEWAEGGMSGA